MKSKTFWKLFAYELTVKFALPIVFLIAFSLVALACVKGYGLSLLLAVLSCCVMFAIGVMVSDAWDKAKRKEGHIRG